MEVNFFLQNLEEIAADSVDFFSIYFLDQSYIFQIHFRLISSLNLMNNFTKETSPFYTPCLK
jgi:hypothetical protein